MLTEGGILPLIPLLEPLIKNFIDKNRDKEGGVLPLLLLLVPLLQINNKIIDQMSGKSIVLDTLDAVEEELVESAKEFLSGKGYVFYEV